MAFVTLATGSVDALLVLLIVIGMVIRCWLRKFELKSVQHYVRMQHDMIGLTLSFHQSVPRNVTFHFAKVSILVQRVITDW